MDHLNRTDFNQMQTCACGSLRKTTRVITQFYDQSLRSTGLRSTQCSMLITISLHPHISVGELASILLMDQTTVTRTIGILREKAYIGISKEEKDARRKSICLTESGTRKLEEVVPLWHEVQSQFEQRMGAEQYQEFMNVLENIESMLR